MLERPVGIGLGRLVRYRRNPVPGLWIRGEADLVSWRRLPRDAGTAGRVHPEEPLAALVQIGLVIPLRQIAEVLVGVCARKVVVILLKPHRREEPRAILDERPATC